MNYTSFRKKITNTALYIEKVKNGVSNAAGNEAIFYNLVNKK